MKEDLERWAQFWGVSKDALKDLADFLSQEGYTPSEHVRTGSSEEAIQNAQRLEAAKAGAWLMRNNVGALKDATGRVVRYGLCNETADVNKRLKSSDLIGIRPRLITPDDVGTTVGQFVAIECKEEGWRYTGSAREAAQLAFGQRIRSLGGYFNFAAGVREL